jgi:hypothetical protein
MDWRTALALLTALLAAHGAASELDDVLNAAPNMPFAEEFDCVNAFDLFASFVMLRCAVLQDGVDDRDAIRAALARLHQLKLVPAAEIAQTDIRFCPLLSGTGLVPAAGRMLLDDGLRVMSADGLAEIIAHEFVHLQQFENLGSANFKCTYVRAMSACGGCQDRGHSLERAAYESQDRARAALRTIPAQPVPPAPELISTPHTGSP